MRALVSIYRSLDQLQRTLWFRLAASALALIICAGFFGAVLSKTYSLDHQRRALVKAMAGANVTRGDEIAVTLKRTGEVFVDGKRYGGPDILKLPYTLIDNTGNILNPGWLADIFLQGQRPAWAPTWLLDQPQTTWLLAVATLVWLLLIIWMQITLQFLLTLLGTAIPVWISRFAGSEQWMVTFAGIGLLTFTFVLLTRVALLALFPSNQILAVAHTVLKEASRRGISLVFIVTLLVMLPLIPLALNDDSALRYRIQSYMSMSLGLTFTTAAMLTLFFSCASVAFEFRDRQIWQLMTKPVARLNYLLGKWVGIAILNMILLIVAGVSIFTYLQYMRQLPVSPDEAGLVDALAVRDEVFSARKSARPFYPPLPPERLKAQLDQRANNDPEYAEKDVPPMIRRAWEHEEQQNYRLAQRTISPGNVAVFRFQGLQDIKKLNSSLTLRYRFHMLRDDEHQTFQARFLFLDEQDQVINQHLSTYVPTQSHSLPIGPDMILNDGTLRIAIANMFDPGQRVSGLVAAVNFEEEDFELFYKAGSFEANFLKAMLTVWFKLSFLAALGICCATFLNFPVACLLSFTIFISGVMGPFLAKSLLYYGWEETQNMDWSNFSLILLWLFENITRSIASVLVFLLSSFGEYRPTDDLVQGRLIPWTQVGVGFLRLGVLWSGLALLLGFAVLRRRQLAIYSGQG